ncbi:DUF4214 domain-containing protein [Massilia varians]|uniref:DUF4214 domain-containing protein n=1 Tax=Massilia varians TaxID=457921 RepID=UPI00361C64D5
MSGPRATITVGVDGANDSRRNLDSVADALRRMNAQSLAGVQGQLSSLNDRIGSVQSTFSNITSFAVAGVSLAMLTDKIGATLDKFGDLDDMAQRTGASIESLSRLQKVASVFGADFGTVGSALANLNKGLSETDDESNKTRKALAFLGISARDSAGKLREPGDLMIDIAKRMQGYKDGAGKAAVANDLFKKSGIDLLPFLGDVAESVDDFSETSREAVEQATGLQDQWGKLRERADELFTGIVVSGLPAMTDFADGIVDVMKAQEELAGSDASSWADDMAVGAARVVDALALIHRTGFAVASSFRVVGADLAYLATTAVEVAKLKNPANVTIEYAKGNDPLAGIKKALSERNKVLEDANAKYDDLWNKPANLFEQAVLKRIADRKGTVNTPEAPEPDKKDANYTTGKDGEAAAAEKAAEAYRALTASIQAKIKQSQIEANTGKAATGAQQERLRVDEQLAKMNLAPKQRAFVEGLLQELETTNEVIASNKRAAEGRADWDKIQQQWLDSNAKVLASAEEEAARNEVLARTFGMTKGAIEQEELARLENQLAQRSSLGLTLDEIEHLEKLIAAKKRSADALVAVDTAEAARKAGEDLDKFLDPTRAQTFGEALKGAFGTAGDSLTMLIGNLDAYAIRQAEVDKARKDAATRFASDSKGYAAASAAISRDELRSRVTAYGDMTAAAKGFFSEGSKGYRALETTEKAFRAYELAMSAETLAKKLFFKEAEVAAHTTLNATKLAGEATTTAASTALAGTEASAWGITAVVKAIASLPFPLNLAAGAATMAAVVAVGAKMFGGVGGSSVSLSQSRQESQGTGSVFGDAGAKSESIARSLERVEDNTYQGLAISMGMLGALTDIKNNIGSFSALVVRDTNITGQAPVKGLGQGSAEEFWSSDKASFLQGGPLGIVLDKLTGGWLSQATGKIMGAIFGGKKTLEDSGFTVDKTTLATIAHGGLNAMSYADIKKDGGWFRSDKMSTQLEGLGADGNRQIANVLLSLSGGIREAGIALGLPADAFAQKLDGFVVDIGKISFKDMKADEIEKTLQAVFSKLGDDMAQFAVGGLEQFQQVGEGYMETLVRIAQGYQSVDVVMQSMGMTFAAIGTDSIAARQRLLDLSGGLEKFVQNSEQFLRDYYTEQEQAAALKARIQPVLDQYGLKASGEDAARMFRDYLVALDPATDAGAKAFATLSQIAPALKQIADAEQYIYDERKDLQQQLDELTMTSAQLLDKQRAALDESNRPLFDQINALKDSKAALEAQVEAQRNLTQATKDRAANLLSGVDSAFSALQTVVGREKALLQETTNAHKALSSALRGTLDSMSVAGREVENRQSARAQVQAALAIAKAGGVLPDADSLRGALSVLSKDASSMFATQQDYLRDFYSTQNDIAALAGLTDDALSVEEQSLKALDGILDSAQQQINALKGIDLSVFSVAQALSGMERALGAAKAAPVASAGGSIANLYRELLGRPADSAGLDYWQNAVASGMSLDQVRKMIMESAEYKGIPGFASGGMFGGGLRIVGENGPELEATGPSRIWNASQTSALMSSLRSPSEGTAVLAAAVERLTREVEGLRAETRAVATHTEKSGRLLGRVIRNDALVTSQET